MAEASWSTLQICLQSEYRSHRRLAATTVLGTAAKSSRACYLLRRLYAVVSEGDRDKIIGSVGIDSKVRFAPQRWRAANVRLAIGLAGHVGQGLIPEAVSELIRYAFEVADDYRLVRIFWWQRNQNECKRNADSLTIYEDTTNLSHWWMNVRTEHFTKLTLEEWRKRKTDMRIGSIDMEMFAPCGMNARYI